MCSALAAEDVAGQTRYEKGRLTTSEQGCRRSGSMGVLQSPGIPLGGGRFCGAGAATPTQWIMTCNNCVPRGPSM